MKIKRILFLRPEHIGDYGMSLPALKALRKKFPGSKIDVAVGPWNKNFAEATPYINEVIVFDNPLIKRNLRYLDIVKFIFSKQMIKMLGFIKKINDKNYDLLISLSDRKFNIILLKLFKSREKILGTEIRNTGFDERYRIRNLFSKHNIIIDDSPIKLSLTYADNKIIRETLNRDAQFKKKIIIHAITPLKEKNWPMKNWRNLIKRFQNENYVFYLIGSDDQKKDLDRIKDGFRNVRNLAGEMSIVQIIKFMDKCDLIIGSDSGPVHLAEMTKIKIISLFGATNAEMWGTPEKKGRVLNGENIENIVVSDVEREIREILK